MNEDRIKSLKIKGNMKIIEMLYEERDLANKQRKNIENDEYIAYISKEILIYRDAMNELSKEKFSISDYLSSLKLNFKLSKQASE